MYVWMTHPPPSLAALDATNKQQQPLVMTEAASATKYNPATDFVSGLSFHRGEGALCKEL